MQAGRVVSLKSPQCARTILATAFAASACTLTSGCIQAGDDSLEPGTGQAEQSTICGSTNDAQHVQFYDGTLGPSIAFVNANKSSKGALETLASNSIDPKYCSGSLLGGGMFLTAGHCVDSSTIGDFVAFNYELVNPGQALATQTHFQVTQVLEDELGGLDYAVLQLAGDPNAAFGVAPLAHDTAEGAPISIIGFPAGEPKQIAAGAVSALVVDKLHYSIDTLGGSSGSGVLNPSGAIVGVHTNGGCTSSGGFNFGQRISAIRFASRVISSKMRTDILWRNSGSNEIKVWTMDGAEILSQPTVSASAATADWHIQGIGDFDSNTKSDILWRNDSGEVKLWLMEGPGILSTPTVAVIGQDWQINGVGDFNNDDMSDILWRNSSGEVKIWTMNGSSITSQLTVTAPGVVGLDWQVKGVGDFNNDAKSDILWRNSGSNEVRVWLMDGGTIVSQHTVAAAGAVGADWQPHGIGSLDPDGKDDILWRNTGSGEVKLWRMDGGSIASQHVLAAPGVVGLDWQIRNTGDFNGDGKDDILWRNTGSGEVKLWLMNGASITSQLTVTGGGIVGLDWQTQGTGEFSP